jgi:hypothetical protein
MGESMITLKHKVKLIYPNSKWQKQHIDMIKKLRFDDTNENYEDYIACPYCKRRFAPIPAEKHIEKCKDIINRPKPPKTKYMLPSIYDKNISFVREFDSQPGKITSRNPSSTRIGNKSVTDGGFTERVMPNDIRLEEVQIGAVKKAQIKKLEGPRSKSIYKMGTGICKCGEALPNRAVYCMMCGLCRYG